MAEQQTQSRESSLKPMNMYMWRLKRHEAEKHEENVHREIMRRQHRN